MKIRPTHILMWVPAILLSQGCTSTFGQPKMTAEYLKAVVASADSIARAGEYSGAVSMTATVAEDGKSGLIKVRGRGPGTFSCSIRIAEGNHMAAPRREVDDFFSMGVRRIGGDTVAYYRSDIEARLAFHANGRTVTIDLMRDDKRDLTFIEDIARLIHAGL